MHGHFTTNLSRILVEAEKSMTTEFARPPLMIWYVVQYVTIQKNSGRNCTIFSFHRSQQFHFLVFFAMRAEFLLKQNKTYDHRSFKNSTNDIICKYLKHSDRKVFISSFSQIGRPANMNLPMVKSLKFPGVVKVE